VKTQFTVFEGCDHAFCNDSRPDVYNQDAAKLAIRITQDFLKANL
jgi:dienelactone hydrolase